MSNYPVQHEIRPLSRAQLRQLMADLSEQRVAKRKQGASTLSYIEAWDARRAMIRIFGFGGFSTRIVNVRTIHQEQNVPALDYKTKQHKKDDQGNLLYNWRVAVETTVEVYIHQLGAIYADAGVASQVGPDIGEVADFATKTATSDTFKRCVINLGTQFGLSLYDNGSLSDVVKSVIATGQRALDVDWAAYEAREDEDRRRATLKAEADAAAGPRGGAPHGTTTPPTSAPEAAVPTDDEQAAATATLAKGFGGQA